MATVGTGGWSLLESGNQPKVDTVAELVTCGAEIVDGQNQSAVRRIALAGIRDAINDANLSHLFRACKRVSSDLTITAGTRTVAVPTNYYAMHGVQLVGATDAEPKFDVDEVFVGDLNDHEYKQDLTGRPKVWYQISSYNDGVIYFYPIPDAAAAADYKARLTYYIRVPQVTSEADVIDMPIELGSYLCWRIKGWVLLHRDRADVAARRECLGKAADLLNKFNMRDKHQEATVRRITVPRARGLRDTRGEFDPLSD